LSHPSEFTACYRDYAPPLAHCVFVTATADRQRPPLTGDERTLLTGFLDFHRATLRITCAGLSDLDSHRKMVPAPMRTAIQLVSHLRWDEHFWCEVVLSGRGQSVRYTEASPSSEFKPGPGTTLEQALDGYDRQCAISREITDRLDLDHEVAWHDRMVSVRWVLIRLLEETARHNGHLDAIRELIDGANDGAGQSAGQAASQGAAS
jgi:hypothetical protein